MICGCLEHDLIEAVEGLFVDRPRRVQLEQQLAALVLSLANGGYLRLLLVHGALILRFQVLGAPEFGLIVSGQRAVLVGKGLAGGGNLGLELLDLGVLRTVGALQLCQLRELGFELRSQALQGADRR